MVCSVPPFDLKHKQVSFWIIFYFFTIQLFFIAVKDFVYILKFKCKIQCPRKLTSMYQYPFSKSLPSDNYKLKMFLFSTFCSKYSAPIPIYLEGQRVLISLNTGDKRKQG